MATLTPRKQHCKRLGKISKITGIYDRKFAFNESSTFLQAYEYYREEGWPNEEAAQRAFDHIYAGKCASKELNIY